MTDTVGLNLRGMRVGLVLALLTLVYGLGGTGAAKGALEWLAVPTSGLVIVGLLLTLYVTVRTLFRRQ